MKKFKKAVLFQNGGIGDFLMAIYLAEQLKNNGITEKIYIIVHKGGEFLRGFIENYPYITLLEITPRRPKSLFLFKSLWGSHNLVILPPTIGKFLLKTKFLAWLLSKPGGILVGFQDDGLYCSTLYTKLMQYRIDQTFDVTMLDVLRALHVSPLKVEPRLNIESSKKVVEQLCLTNKRYIVFHPRGASDRRRLTDEEIEKLINFMLHMSPERMIVITGAEYERKDIERLLKNVQNSHRVLPAIGSTAKELAGLIKTAEIFIGMDTGITHLSCFLGQCTLVIAKNATANWLPYYNRNAKVIFRLHEDEASSTSEDYMWERQNGRLRPFKDIPIQDVCVELGKMLN